MLKFCPEEQYFEMDELDRFFKGELKRTKLRGPLTSGIRLTKDDDKNIINRKTEHQISELEQGTDYVQEARLLHHEQVFFNLKNFTIYILLPEI